MIRKRHFFSFVCFAAVVTQNAWSGNGSIGVGNIWIGEGLASNLPGTSLQMRGNELVNQQTGEKILRVERVTPIGPSQRITAAIIGALAGTR